MSLVSESPLDHFDAPEVISRTLKEAANPVNSSCVPLSSPEFARNGEECDVETETRSQSTVTDLSHREAFHLEGRGHEPPRSGHENTALPMQAPTRPSIPLLNLATCVISRPEIQRKTGIPDVSSLLFMIGLLRDAS